MCHVSDQQLFLLINPTVKVSKVKVYLVIDRVSVRDNASNRTKFKLKIYFVYGVYLSVVYFFFARDLLRLFLI